MADARYGGTYSDLTADFDGSSLLGDDSGDPLRSDIGDAPFDLVATLAGAGLKAIDAGGSLAASATLAGSGQKAAIGTGTLAASADLSGDGFKREANGGTITTAVTLAGDGVKAAAGGDILALTAALDGDGTAAQAGAAVGGGTLATSAGFVGDGTKATVGGGVVVLSAHFAGKGTASGQVQPLPITSALRTARHHPLTIRRVGGGHLALHVVLAGDGRKTTESDDELVMALAA
jgi:hypothetical protein